MPEGFKIATAYVEVKANVDDQSARDAGTKVGEEASKGAQDTSKSGGGIAGSLLIAGIAAAAPIAGAAIIAGVGLGLIGLVALADKNNAQIQASWKNLTSNLKGETQDAASGISGELAAGLDTIDHAALAAKPQLDAIFAGVKPDIPIVASGISGMVTNLLPGLAAAAKNSQPVMQGTANLLTTLGTTGSDALTKLSQNAGNFGAVMTSTGNIVHSAVNTVINVASDLGTVWGQNASRVSSAIGGIGSTISGLASGVVPVLSAGLGVVTNDITMITGAIGPMTPALGAMGSAAVLGFGAFKLAGLATSGIKSASSSIVDFGAKVENTSPKLGGMIGNVGIAANSIAGPLGQAVVLGAVGLSLYADMANRGAISSTDMANASSALTTALNQTGGAVTSATTSALKNTQAWKDLVPQLQAAGISQDDAVNAIEHGGPALDTLNTKLGSTGQGQHDLSVETKGANTSLNDQSQQTKETKSNLDALNVTFQQAVTDAKAQAQAAQEAADAQTSLNLAALQTTGINFTGPAGTIKTALAGIGNAASDDKTKVNDLSNALQALINPGGAAISTLAGISTTEQGLGDQLKSLKGPLVDAAGNLDLNSTRGAAAATAIEGLSKNYSDYAAQAKEAGVPTATINANLQTQYDNLVKTAEQFGVNKDKVGAYLASLGILPPTTQTTAEFDDTKALSLLTQLGIKTTTLPNGSISVAALTDDAANRLTSLGYTVTHMPDGSVTITADPTPALNVANSLVYGINNRVATIKINGVVTGVTGGGSITNLLKGAGGITPRMNAGGNFTAVAPIAGFASPGSPVSPDGGRNILGDRPDVAEAFIPMDSSARSGAILDEVNARMPGHGGGNAQHYTYSPVNHIYGSSPGEVTAAMQAEFSWYTMMMGRAA